MKKSTRLNFFIFGAALIGLGIGLVGVSFMPDLKRGD